MQYKALNIEVLRGSHIESCHEVHISIVTHQKGETVTFGDPEFNVFPRSSIKPIQAIPLIVTGAAQKFQVTPEELALACASHWGEIIHVNLVTAWLQRMGLSSEDLECGAHPPMNQQAALDLIKKNETPSAVHNNCSGKHTGMLATALHLGESLKNYVTFHHPVQSRVTQVLERFSNFEIPERQFGIDGCSIPSPIIPLQKMALALCEFGRPSSRIPDKEAQACHEIYQAFTKHPELTSGTGQFCSNMMTELKGLALIKGGAEGVMAVSIPKLEMGMALKALDGAQRGVELATSFLLHKLGLLDQNSPYLNPKMYNWRQTETGSIQVQASACELELIRDASNPFL